MTSVRKQIPSDSAKKSSPFGASRRSGSRVFPLSPKLFDLYVYTRRPGSSAVVPGLDHDVVRAGSHFQVSIESFAVLLVLQPIIDVNLNGEHGARARDRSVNVNWRSDGRVGRR